MYNPIIMKVKMYVINKTQLVGSYKIRRICAETK